MRQTPYFRSVAMFAIATTLAACATAPSADELAYEDDIKSQTLIPATQDQRTQIKAQDPMTQATFWSIEYEKSPGNAEVALEFAKALRAIGSEKRAADIASQALALAPDNTELMAIYGKSLLTSGDPNAAVDILRRAYASNPADFTVLGALGVAYDQTGRYREAQSTYQQALNINPNSTANLSNYGLSLALTGEPEKAEIYLRRSVDQPNAGTRERQNLALVLSVQGKFDEARDIGSTDLPDNLVDQNIEYFKAMLTPQSRSYTQLRGTLE